MRLSSVAVTETGHVRTHNEDAVYGDDERGLWLVADGMGGHAAGEVASRIAIEVVSEQAGRGVPLDDAIRAAHQAVIDAAQADPERHGMGSTMVAARLKGSGFELAWVGDSRLYSYDVQEGLAQLSVDHSFVQDMVCRGVLTEEEAKSHPKRSLIHQSLGKTGDVRVDGHDWRPLQPGTLLLCSDGVSDMLTPAQMQEVLASGGDLSETAEHLRNAVLATPAVDNASFVMIRYMPQVMDAVSNRLRRLFG